MAFSLTVFSLQPPQLAEKNGTSDLHPSEFLGLLIQQHLLDAGLKTRQAVRLVAVANAIDPDIDVGE